MTTRLPVRLLGDNSDDLDHAEYRAALKAARQSRRALLHVDRINASFHPLPGFEQGERLTPVWHVGLFRVTREYGGPEEGGWYYDRCTLEETWTVPPGLQCGLRTVRQAVRAGLDNWDGREIGSVLSRSGEYWIGLAYTETALDSAQFNHDSRPHYE